ANSQPDILAGHTRPGTGSDVQDAFMHDAEVHQLIVPAPVFRDDAFVVIQRDLQETALVTHPGEADLNGVIAVGDTGCISIGGQVRFLHGACPASSHYHA